MNAILIPPSRKYFDSYVQACKEYEESSEHSFLHDLYEFGHLKRNGEISFSAWKKGVIRQSYFDIVDGKYQMLYVPSTIFWLVNENEYLGIGIIRHHLTKSIEEYGGHIGYAIRRTKWNQGYGKLQLKLLLKEAYKLKINPALVTCDEENIASVKIIEENGGKLWDKLPTYSEGKNILLHRYWVPTNIK